MNRCSTQHLLACGLLALSAATCAAQSTAVPTVQTVPVPPKAGQHRNFPATVQYGVLRVDHMPMVQVNGQDTRTAPGFRLFSPDNKLIFAHTVQGQPLRVAYVREASTQWLLTAWILTEEELQALPTKR